MIDAPKAGSPRRDRLVELLRLSPIIPVITIERVEDAVPLGRALVAGGLRLLEITLRTPVARASAEAIVADVPGAIVGIGTVLSKQDLALASEIGAQFALSPGATQKSARSGGGARSALHPGHRHKLRADERPGAWI